jgi:hypothetical protein
MTNTNIAAARSMPNAESRLPSQLKPSGRISTE